MKQAVAPLQAIEVGIIRKKLASFDVKQHQFRETFRKNAPFSFSSDAIYKEIDEVCHIRCLCSTELSMIIDGCNFCELSKTMLFEGWNKK